MTASQGLNEREEPADCTVGKINAAFISVDAIGSFFVAFSSSRRLLLAPLGHCRKLRSLEYISVVEWIALLPPTYFPHISHIFLHISHIFLLISLIFPTYSFIFLTYSFIFPSYFPHIPSYFPHTLSYFSL